MKKALGVIIISLFLSVFSGIPAECYSNDSYSDSVIFTVKRDVFNGYFERSPYNGDTLYTEGGRYLQNITFTRVYIRNKSAERTELLFEMKRDIKDFYFINEKFYLLTNEGVYTCDINGKNVQLIIDEEVRCFAVSDDSVFYCIYSSDIENYQIIKCDLDGGNRVVIANKEGADKLTIVDGGLIFSDSVHVGKISGDNQVDYYITNLVVPMPGGDTGSHFVVNNNLIVSGYMAPEDEKYGEYPTIILDLEGNVLDVWENAIVCNIEESNGKIYASIVNGGTYYVSINFKERKQVQAIGFKYMYIEANSIYINRGEASWLKGDIMPDGTIENLESEPIEADYVSDIEVLVLNENPVNEAPPGGGTQYRGELLTFDVPPKMQGDHVLIPLRRVFESLGATVAWDEATRTVATKKNNVELTLQVDDGILYINDEEIALSVSVELVDGRTLVPLQVVIEGLNARVTWDETKNAVWIWAR